jgi:uncharacterized protein
VVEGESEAVRSSMVRWVRESMSNRLNNMDTGVIFQIVSVAHHSLGAVQGLKKGVFAPPGQTGALDYGGLQKLIADAVTDLQGLSPTEVNALEGREIVFQMRDRQIPFTAEDFVISFSLPNFYFHCYSARD